MDLDPSGAAVAVSAAVVVLIGVVVHVVGGSRFGVVLGIRPGAPLLLNPVGARLQGALVAYGASLVAVGALVHAVLAPRTATSALPVQVGFAAAAALFALTVARVGRYAVGLLSGRAGLVEGVAPHEVVPVDEVGDDLDLAAALEAAGRGEWRPAAALLRATGDPDVRMDRIRGLTRLTVHDGQWVEEWFAAEPRASLVTAVRAEMAMQRAWAARGAGRAEHTSDDQFRAFATALGQAERLAVAATEQAPEDPTPWATLVEMARGQGVPQAEFERRMAELFERAPHHAHGSFAVLQTLCPKWMGTPQAMFDCARTLAAGAPEGSATCLLPLMAHVEHYVHLADGPGGMNAATRHIESGTTRTELRVAAQRWLSGPDGGPRPGSRLFGHNLAAFVFWLAEDRDAARPHLQAIGRSVTELPWAYNGEPGELLGVVRTWAGLPAVAPTAAEAGSAPSAV